MGQARILVVEHDPTVADYVVDVIRHGGWETAGPAHTLMHALDLLAHESIDGAVIDLRPEADAISLPVASLLHKRNIPFLFMTGGICAPACFQKVAIVGKPFTHEVLIRELSKLLILS